MADDGHVDWREVALPVDADRERVEPMVSHVQLDSLGPIAEIMRAAGTLLRAVEDEMRESTEANPDPTETVFRAADELRATFDKWLPGWDTDEAGLDLN